MFRAFSWSLKQPTVWTIRVLVIFTFTDAFCDFTDNFKNFISFIIMVCQIRCQLMATVPVLSLPTVKSTIHKYFFFYVVWLKAAHPTVFMTYLCLLSFSSCAEVAVESSSAPFLEQMDLVVQLEIGKIETVLTVFLPHGDGLNHFWKEFPPAPQVLLS